MTHEECSMVLKHEKELYGDGDKFGVTQKLNIMWKFHTALMCGFSGALGCLATLGIQKLL